MGNRMLGAIFIMALFSFAGPIFAGESEQCKDWVVKIAAVTGKVEAKRNQEQDWILVKRNNTYCPGDLIRAGKESTATLVFTNETLVTLNEFTAITITQIEANGSSVLDILKGIAHFISRVPRSLKVNTPFVNAAIEGTEFVVEVNDKETRVTVFEGTVLTSNEQGELRVTNNETSSAQTGQAPVKILLARPRDTVQWALYFPPLIKANASGNKTEQASVLLYKGQVEQARALLKDDDSGEAKALSSIIAIVTNNGDALALAKQAIERSPDSAASHIAMSYALQSRLQLHKALNSSTTATVKEPNNAIAWARLAELQLSVGELNQALTSALKANELDNSLARAQSVLGFAYLTQIQIDKARATFNTAIELDQSDPLPHLGLGLALIRENKLAEGRREIEIAAALDPNNAIIRSYLGKAYFEERRDPLDKDQFVMAKELDPNDPTPYYYDAIRKQNRHDPIGALNELNKSIELNDNRAVYRSSLQIDQDAAARSASLAGIYQQLGFEQVAINQATQSLSQDPANHSAHLLLADAYSNRERHEIGQASELFQARMLQPLGLTILRPQSAFSDLDTLSYANNFGNSSSDFSSLYTRNKTVAQLNLFHGNNGTLGDELSVATLYDNFAISFAQYAFKNDGYRANNDVDHEIYDLFVQAQLSNRFSMQFEIIDRNTDKGDLSQNFIPTDFVSNERNTIDSLNSRVGFRYILSPNQTLLGSHIYDDKDSIKQIISSATFPFVSTTTVTQAVYAISRVSELQHLYTKDNLKITSGLAHFNRNSHLDFSSVTVITFPFNDIFASAQNFNLDQENTSVYSYANWSATENLNITLGASLDEYKQRNTKISRINPKLGADIRLSDRINMQFASFSVLNHPFVNNQTLEPSQVAGFNQYFADANGAKIVQHNIGLDIKPTNSITTGYRFSYRDIDSPIITVDNVRFDDMRELSNHFYFNWVINNYAALSASWFSDNFENLNSIISGTPRKVKTEYYPISLSIHYPNRLAFRVTPTYVSQDYVTSAEVNSHDSFWVTELSAEYFFFNNKGSLSIGIHNLFDKEFSYYNLSYTGENNEPRFIPDRSIIIQLKIRLD